VTYRCTSSRVKRASSRRGIFGAPRTRRSAPSRSDPADSLAEARRALAATLYEQARYAETAEANYKAPRVEASFVVSHRRRHESESGQTSPPHRSPAHASSVLCSTTTHPSRQRSASMLNERRSRRRDPLQSAGPADVVGHVVGQGLRLVGAGATQRVRYVSTKGSQLLRGVLRQPQFGRLPAYGSDLTELAGIARTR